MSGAGLATAKRRTVLERNFEKVLELVLDGLTDSQVAAGLAGRRFSVSRQAVTAFRSRHKEEIERRRDELTERVADLVLTSKETRIRELSWWYGQMKDEAVQYGLTVVESKTTSERGADPDEDSDDESAEKVVETVTSQRAFRGRLVREARGVLHDIAVELGQLPQAPKGINISGSQVVIVRETPELGV